MAAKKSKSPLTGNELKEVVSTLKGSEITKEMNIKEYKNPELEETIKKLKELDVCITETKYDLNWFYMRQKILSFSSFLSSNLKNLIDKIKESKNE